LQRNTFHKPHSTWLSRVPDPYRRARANHVAPPALIASVTHPRRESSQARRPPNAHAGPLSRPRAGLRGASQPRAPRTAAFAYLKWKSEPLRLHDIVYRLLHVHAVTDRYTSTRKLTVSLLLVIQGAFQDTERYSIESVSVEDDCTDTDDIPGGGHR